MRILILSFTIFLFILACHSRDSEDHTFTPQEYDGLGIPSHDRHWTGADYNAACRNLFKVRYQAPLSLPRKSSKKSGPLFERLVSLENLSFLKNDTIPLHNKAYQISIFVNIQSTLLDIYYNASTREQYYSTELAHIYIFGLQIAEQMLELANEINESKDSRDKHMQYEFETIRISYMKMLEYVLGRSKHRALYGLNDFILLSDSIASSISRNLIWFDSASIDHLQPALQAMIDSSSIEELKEQYSVLIDSLLSRR